MFKTLARVTKVPLSTANIIYTWKNNNDNIGNSDENKQYLLIMC